MYLQGRNDLMHMIKLWRFLPVLSIKSIKRTNLSDIKSNKEIPNFFLNYKYLNVP